MTAAIAAVSFSPYSPKLN